MILLIFIIVVILCLKLSNFLDRHSPHGLGEFANCVFLGIEVIFSLAVIILGLLAFSNNIQASADVASYKVHYDTIMYKIDNSEDLTSEDKQKLITEISNWNYDLARKKEIRKNIWIKFMYPNIYDQFDFISLKELNR